MQTRTRLKRAQRRRSIIDAALACARREGLAHVTRSEIARRSGVSRPLVVHYFPTMAMLWSAIVAEAVRTEVLTIVAQGLALEIEEAMNAPEGLRRRAADHLVRLI